MEKNVKISVIMSVYDPGNLLQVEMAVRSVLEQSFRDLEFLIYDDGSGEKTAGFLRQLARKDERIRLFRGEKNRGIAVGLNTCIRLSRGEYIARMDADDISLPDRLKEQMEFLDGHPEYGFVGCSAGILEGTTVRSHRKMPRRPQKKDFLPYSPYIHPSVMFRRWVLEACHGYCESGRTLRCEDYELFMRLHVLGHYGYNLQKELFLYREDEGSYQRRKFCFRMDEMLLRRKGFRMLGISGPEAWIQMFRPLLAALLPGRLLLQMKRKGDPEWTNSRLLGIPQMRSWRR